MNYNVFEWEKAALLDVRINSLPQAVKDAYRVGCNIYKELRSNVRLELKRAVNVPYGDSISFRETDDAKAYAILHAGVVVGIITHNTYRGLRPRVIQCNFASNRYKTKYHTVACISVDEKAAHYANLILFNEAFKPGALVDFMMHWTLPSYDDVGSTLYQLYCRVLERKYHEETASDFCFEEGA